MKVIIDITPLRGQKTGIGNYLHYTLRQLLLDNYEIDITTFSVGIRRFTIDSAELLKKIGKKRTLPIPATLIYRYWNAFTFPKVDWFLPDADLYHATNYYLPPSKIRTILSIYDLSFFKNPVLSNRKIVSLFSKRIKKNAHIANHIITCSNYSKREIVTLLDIPDQKVSVAYPGIDSDVFYPSEKLTTYQTLKEKYNIPYPFLLFVGTIEERKNVEGLLEIFEKLSNKLPHYLVIVGKKGSAYLKVSEKLKSIKSGHRVIILDYIEKHSDLRLFYTSADLFIFPSLDEGFGIPVLEAMACGCPVVSSNKGATTEVVGEQGTTCDPLDIDGFAEKVLQVLSSSLTLQKLSDYGIQRSKEFTWKNTAKIHYEVYKKVAQND